MALTPGAGTGDSVSQTKFVVVDAVSSKGNQLFSRVTFFFVKFQTLPDSWIIVKLKEKYEICVQFLKAFRNFAPTEMMVCEGPEFQKLVRLDLRRALLPVTSVVRLSET